MFLAIANSAASASSSLESDEDDDANVWLAKGDDKKKALQDALTTAAVACGYDAKDYSSHSLRSGGATAAAISGLSPAEICHLAGVKDVELGHFELGGIAPAPVGTPQIIGVHAVARRQILIYQRF